MKNKNKLTHRPLRKLLSYVFPYWGRLFIAFIALVASTSMFILIGKGLGDLTDIIFAKDLPVDEMTLRLNQLMVYAAPVLGFFALGVFLRNYLMQWIGERAGINLRNDVFENIIQLSPSFYDKNSYGQVQTRITSDARELQDIIGKAIPNLVHHFILLFAGVAYSIYLSPELSMVVAACIPVIFIPGAIWSGKVKRLSSEKQSALAVSGGYVGEVLRNLKLIQAYVYQSEGAKRYRGMLSTLFAVSVRSVRLDAFLNALTSLLAYVTLLAVLWFGGQQIFAGKITSGELVMFIYFANVVTNSAAQLVSVIVSLSAATGAAERLLELRDENKQVALPVLEGDVKLLPSVIQGGIKFDALSFAYPSQPDNKVLQGIDLHIKPGQTISIVGPSGAGKSTLFDLLQNFYKPQNGRILVDGVDINDIDISTLMNTMAIVPQNPELFSGSVIDNLRLGALEATEESAWSALETAQIADFIRAMPDGLDTDLGKDGTRLSGGQKQRIAIARAVMKNPKILLLDEPTSALDIESDALIQKAFDASRNGRTTLIITHRLSTAIKADAIVMIMGGRILAIGGHEELMEGCLEYAGLVRLSMNESFDQPPPSQPELSANSAAE